MKTEKVQHACGAAAWPNVCSGAAGALCAPAQVQVRGAELDRLTEPRPLM